MCRLVCGRGRPAREGHESDSQRPRASRPRPHRRLLPQHSFGLLMRRPPGPAAPIPDRQSPFVQFRSAGDLHPLGPRIWRHLLLPRRLDGCVFPEPSQPHRVGPGLAIAEFRQRQSDPEQPLVSGRRPADQRRLGMAAAAAPLPARLPSRTHGVVRPHHEPPSPKKCWPPGRTARSATSIRK